MSLSVTLTTSAKQDVRSIVGWIQQRSPAGAESWYRRWLEILDRLGQWGDSMGVAPENEDHEETIRQVIFKTRHGLPYRALFFVRDNDLFVLRVRGPGQDLVLIDDLPLPE
jgi:plasmid stabilization system protein ParE